MTKIGIIVPVLNYFEGFADLMLSIKTKHDYRVYVQPQWHAQVPLAAAWNRGAQQAFAEGCEYALVCNDDILFAPECIDNMVAEYDLLNKLDKVIMVTPNNIYGELPNKYAVLGYKLPASQESSVADHPNFSCFLITPEYFEKVGPFDEKFTPAWFEDNDSHRRATLAGLREVCTTAAPMIHLGSITTNRLSNPQSGKSQKHYIDKWGGLPGHETFERPYSDPTKTLRDW